LTSEQREIADGTLVVRSQESDGRRVIAFAGELDLANAGTAESALEGPLADASTPVIVDMRGSASSPATSPPSPECSS
jgi:anti-anti-sigma regulatory factor